VVFAFPKEEVVFITYVIYVVNICRRFIRSYALLSHITSIVLSGCLGLLSLTKLVLFCPKDRMVKDFIVPSEDRADLQLKHQKIIVFIILRFIEFSHKNMTKILVFSSLFIARLM